MPRDDEEWTSGQLGSLFETAQPLTNSEVFIILDRVLMERKQSQEKGEWVNQSNESILNSFYNYVQSLHNFPNSDSVIAAKALVGKSDSPITPLEFAQINNLRIEDAEECISLIPTVRKRIENEELTPEILEQFLQTIKQYQIQ